MTKILFIGDSITDAGRREDPLQIGTGYVKLIADYLSVSYPAKQLEILNKGIGGDRVIDLAERWEVDVMSQAPDVISISIGINDVWFQLDGVKDVQVYPDEFRQVYDDLLTQVRNQTRAQIVLMEPTIIEEDIDSMGNQTLKAYVEIVQELVEKHQAILVPTHEVFMNHLKTANHCQLTTDGVHMNDAGNMLMAKTWLTIHKDLI